MSMVVPYNEATKAHHDRALGYLPFYAKGGRPGFNFWYIPDGVEDSTEQGAEYARRCLRAAQKEDFTWLLEAVSAAMVGDVHLDLQGGFWSEITRLAIKGLDVESAA